MHFGWRGRDEQWKVQLGDFEIRKDPSDGLQFVQFCVERGTKTRTGLEGQQERAFSPRMCATGDERCPVELFKKYLEKRPPAMMTGSSPFFLQPIDKPKSAWYKCQPCGERKLGDMMKSMARVGGLNGHKTNHSTRKTMISRLTNENIPPLYIAQLSGHKNLKSLESYAKASDDQQKEMSLAISRKQSLHSTHSTKLLHNQIL